MIDDMLDDLFLGEDSILDDEDISLLKEDDPFDIMKKNKDYHSDSLHLLFAYGTMKRDFPNHHRIIRTPHRFLGEAVTVDACFSMSIKLSSAGLIVPVVSNGGNKHIRGELYEINGPTLLTIDQAEGVPYTYDRKPILVHTNNKKYESMIYLNGSLGYSTPESIRESEYIELSSTTNTLNFIIK